jgi:hypothetical protein
MGQYNASTSSGLLSGNTQVSALPGKLAELSVGPGATAICYDNASGAASGLVIAKLVNAGTSTLSFVPKALPAYNQGLYVTISGGEAVIYFVPG